MFWSNLTPYGYNCNKLRGFYLQSPFTDQPIVAKMLAKLLRRSSSTTSDGINTWELPRLHRNSYCNNKEKIAHILSKKKVDVNKLDSRGRTALHYGCLGGAKEAVDLLLKSGLGICIIADRRGLMPLHLAINNGHLECVQVFVANGHDFLERLQTGENLLHYSITKKQPEIAEYLVKNTKIDINACDWHKLTALHMSVGNGYLQVATALLESGAKIDAADCHGRTPLMLAAASGEAECVMVLVEHGANPSFEDKKGYTAVTWAFKKNEEKIVSYLQTAQFKYNTGKPVKRPKDLASKPAPKKIHDKEVQSQGQQNPESSHKQKRGYKKVVGTAFQCDSDPPSTSSSWELHSGESATASFFANRISAGYEGEHGSTSSSGSSICKPVGKSSPTEIDCVSITSSSDIEQFSNTRRRPKKKSKPKSHATETVAQSLRQDVPATVPHIAARDTSVRLKVLDMPGKIGDGTTAEDNSYSERPRRISKVRFSDTPEIIKFAARYYQTADLDNELSTLEVDSLESNEAADASFREALGFDTSDMTSADLNTGPHNSIPHGSALPPSIFPDKPIEAVSQPTTEPPVVTPCTFNNTRTSPGTVDSTEVLVGAVSQATNEPAEIEPLAHDWEKQSEETAIAQWSTSSALNAPHITMTVYEDSSAETMVTHPAEPAIDNISSESLEYEINIERPYCSPSQESLTFSGPSEGPDYLSEKYENELGVERPLCRPSQEFFTLPGPSSAAPESLSKRYQYQMEVERPLCRPSQEFFTLPGPSSAAPESLSKRYQYQMEVERPLCRPSQEFFTLPGPASIVPESLSKRYEYQLSVQRPLCRPSQEFFTLPSPEDLPENNNTVAKTPSMNNLWLSDSEANLSNFNMKTPVSIFKESCPETSSSGSYANLEFVVASNINLQRGIGEHEGNFYPNSDKIIGTDSKEMTGDERFSSRKIQLLRDKNDELVQEMLQSNQNLCLGMEGGEIRENILKASASNIEIAKDKDKYKQPFTKDLKGRFDALLQQKNTLQLEVISERRNSEAQGSKIVDLKSKIKLLENENKALKASNKYYEEKVVNLTKDRVSQSKEISRLGEVIRKLEAELPSVDSSRKDYNEISSEGVNLRDCYELFQDALNAEPTTEDKDSSETISVANDKSIDEANEGEKAPTVKKLSQNAKGDPSCSDKAKFEAEASTRQVMIPEASIESKEDNDFVVNQVNQRKMHEELRMRFIDKGEKLEKELIQMRTDLKNQTEKSRRMSLRDELKDRFVLLGERLQSEMAALRKDNKSLADEKSKLLEELKSKQQQLDGQDRMAATVKEQEEAIETLRNGLCDARTKQSMFMRLHAECKQKAEMYDELVGSTLQLEESLMSSYRKIEELETTVKNMEQPKDTANNTRSPTEVKESLNTMKDLAVQIDTFKSQIKQLEQENAKLTSQNKNLSEEIECLTRKNDKPSVCLIDRKGGEETQTGVARSVPNSTPNSVPNSGQAAELEALGAENSKLIRELWKVRQSLDKSENENAGLQEECRELEARIESLRKRVNKGGEHVISVEDLLEENAKLMEENEEIAEKYKELLTNLKQGPGEGTDVSEPNERSNLLSKIKKEKPLTMENLKAIAGHGNAKMRRATIDLGTRNTDFRSFTGAAMSRRATIASDRPLFVKENSILAGNIDLSELVRALESDTDEDETISKGSHLIEIVESSNNFSESNLKEKDLLEDIKQLAHVNNNLKDDIRFLEGWSDDLNEAVLNLQKDVHEISQQKFDLEETLRRREDKSKELQEKVDALVEENTALADKCEQFGLVPKTGKEIGLGRSRSLIKLQGSEEEVTELVALTRAYELLEERAEEWNAALSDKIQGLQAHLHEVCEDKSHLKRENDTLRTENETMKALVGKDDALKEKIEELSERNETLLFELFEARRKLGPLKSDETDQNIEGDTTSAEAHEINNPDCQNVDLVKQNEQLQKEVGRLHNVSAELSAKMLENKELKTQVSLISAEKENIQDKCDKFALKARNIDSLKMENSSLQTTIEGLSVELKLMKNNAKKSKETKEEIDLSKENELLRQEITCMREMSGGLSEPEKIVLDLRKQISQKANEVTQMHKVCKELTQKAATYGPLKFENTQLRAKIEDLVTERNMLRTELEDRKDRKEEPLAASSKIDSPKTAQSVAMGDSNNSGSSNTNDAMSLCQMDEVKVSELKKENKRLRKEIEKFHNENDVPVPNDPELREETENLKKENARLEAKTTQLRDENRRLDNAVQRATVAQRSRHEYILQLEKECECLGKDSEMLQNTLQQLNDLQADFDHLQVDYNKLEAKVGDFDKIQNQLTEERAVFEQCLKGAKEQRLELARLRKFKASVNKECCSNCRKGPKLQKKLNVALASEKEMKAYILLLENECELVNRDLEQIRDVAAKTEALETVENESASLENDVNQLTAANEGHTTMLSKLQEIGLITTDGQGASADTKAGNTESNSSKEKGTADGVMVLKDGAKLLFEENERLHTENDHLERQMKVTLQKNCNKLLLKEKECSSLKKEIQKLENDLKQLKGTDEGHATNATKLNEPQVGHLSNAESKNASSATKAGSTAAKRSKGRGTTGGFTEPKDTSKSIFAENERLHSENERLERQMKATLQQNCNKLLLKEKECSSLRKEIQKLENNLKQLVDKNEGFVTKLNELQEVKLLNAESNNAASDTEAGSTTLRTTKAKGTTDVLLQLKDEAKSLFEENERLHAENEHLEKQMMQNKEVRDKLDAVMAENLTLQESRNKLQLKEKECDSLQQEIQKLRNDLRELKGTKEGHATKHKPQWNELQEIQLLLAEKADKKSISTDAGAGKASLKTSGAKGTTATTLKLKDQIELLFNENEQLHTKNKHLEKQMKTTLHDNSNKLLLKENECSDLQKEIQKLESDLKELKGTNEEYATKLNVMQEVPLQTDRQDASNDTKTGVPTSKTSRAKGTTDVLLQLKDEAKSLFEENERLHTENEHLEKQMMQNKEVRDKLDAVMAENLTLQESRNKLQLKEKECDSLQQEIQKLRNDVRELKGTKEGHATKHKPQMNELQEIQLLLTEKANKKSISTDAGAGKAASKTSGAKSMAVGAMRLKHQIESLFNENEQLHTKNEHLEKRMKTTIHDNSNKLLLKENECSSLRKTIQKLENDLKQLKDTNEEYATTLNVLQEVPLQTDRQDASNDTKTGVPTSKTSRAKGTTDVLLLLKDEAKSLFEENERLHTENEHLEKQMMQNKEVRDKLDAVMAKNVKLQENCDQFQLKEKECDCLKKEIQRLQNDLKQLRDTNEGYATKQEGHLQTDRRGGPKDTKAGSTASKTSRIKGTADMPHQLRDKAKSLSEENEQLRVEKKHLEEQIRTTVQENGNKLLLKEKECGSLQTVIKKLEKDLKQLKETNEGYATKLKVLQEVPLQTDRQGASNDTKTGIPSSKTSTAKGTTDVLLQLKDEAKSLFEENERLHAENDHLEKQTMQNKEVRDKLDAVMAENLTLQENRNKLQLKEKECDSLQQEIQKLRNDLRALSDTNEGYAAKPNQLQESPLQAERQSASNNAEAGSAALKRNKRRGTTGGIMQMKDEAKSPCKENERVHTANESLEKQLMQNKEVRDKLDAVMAENLTLQQNWNRLRLKEKECDSLRTEVQRLQNDLKQLRDTNEGYATKPNELQEGPLQAERQGVSNNAEAGSAAWKRNKRRGTTGGLMQLKDEAKSLSKENERLHREHDRLEKQMETTLQENGRKMLLKEKECGSLQTEIQKLKNDLSHVESTNKRLATKLTELQEVEMLIADRAIEKSPSNDDDAGNTASKASSSKGANDVPKVANEMPVKLKDKVKSLFEKIEAQMWQNIEVKDKLKAATAKNVTLQQHCNKLQSKETECLNLQKEIQKLESEISQMKGTKERHALRLKTKLIELQEIELLGSERGSEKSASTDTDAGNAASKATKPRGTSDVPMTLKDIVKSLFDKIDDQVRQHKEVRDKLNAVMTKNVTLNKLRLKETECLSLQEEIQKLTTDYETVKKDVEYFQSNTDKHEKTCSKNKELLKSVDTLNQKNSVLEKDIEKLVLDASRKDERLCKEIEMVRSENEVLVKKNMKLIEETEHLTRENNRLEARANQLSEENKGLDNAVERAMKAQRTLDEYIVLLEKECECLGKDSEGLQNNLEEYNNLQADFDNLQVDFNKLESKVQDFDKIQNQLSGERAIFQQCLKGAKEQRLELARLEKYNAKLRRESCSKSKKFLQLQDKLKITLDSEKEMKYYILLLENECELVKEQLQQILEAEVSSLGFQTADNGIASLQNNVSQLKDTIKGYATKLNEQQLVQLLTAEGRRASNYSEARNTASETSGSRVSTDVSLQLEDVGKSLLGENERLRTENEYLEKQMMRNKEVRDKLDAVMAENLTLQENCNKLQLKEKECGSLQQEIQKLKNDLKQLIGTREGNATKHKTQINELQEIQLLLSEKADKKSTSTDAGAGKAASISSGAKGITAGAIKLKDKVESLVNENEQLHTENGYLKEQMTDNKEIRDKLDAVIAENLTLQQNCENFPLIEKKCCGLQQQVQKLEDDVSQLQVKNEELARKLKTQQKEQQEIQLFISERAKAQSTSTDTGAGNTASKTSKSKGTTDPPICLREKFVSIFDENERLHTEKKHLERQMKATLQHNCNKLLLKENECSSLQKEIQKLENDVSQLKASNEGYAIKLGELQERQLQTAERQRASDDTEAGNSASTRSKDKGTTDVLLQLKDEAKSLFEENERLHTENENLKKQMKANLQQSCDKLVVKENECCSLQAEIQKLKNDVSQLRGINEDHATKYMPQLNELQELQSLVAERLSKKDAANDAYPGNTVSKISKNKGTTEASMTLRDKLESLFDENDLLYTENEYLEKQMRQNKLVRDKLDAVLAENVALQQHCNKLMLKETECLNLQKEIQKSRKYEEETSKEHERKIKTEPRELQDIELLIAERQSEIDASNDIEAENTASETSRSKGTTDGPKNVRDKVELLFNENKRLRTENEYFEKEIKDILQQNCNKLLIKERECCGLRKKIQKLENVISQLESTDERHQMKHSELQEIELLISERLKENEIANGTKAGNAASKTNRSYGTTDGPMNLKDKVQSLIDENERLRTENEYFEKEMKEILKQNSSQFLIKEKECCSLRKEIQRLENYVSHLESTREGYPMKLNQFQVTESPSAKRESEKIASIGAEVGNTALKTNKSYSTTDGAMDLREKLQSLVDDNERLLTENEFFEAQMKRNKLMRDKLEIVMKENSTLQQKCNELQLKEKECLTLQKEVQQLKIYEGQLKDTSKEYERKIETQLSKLQEIELLIADRQSEINASKDTDTGSRAPKTTKSKGTANGPLNVKDKGESLLKENERLRTENEYFEKEMKKILQQHCEKLLIKEEECCTLQKEIQKLENVISHLEATSEGHPMKLSELQEIEVLISERLNENEASNGSKVGNVATKASKSYGTTDGTMNLRDKVQSIFDENGRLRTENEYFKKEMKIILQQNCDKLLIKEKECYNLRKDIQKLENDISHLESTNEGYSVRLRKVKETECLTAEQSSNKNASDDANFGNISSKTSTFYGTTDGPLNLRDRAEVLFEENERLRSENEYYENHVKQNKKLRDKLDAVMEENVILQLNCNKLQLKEAECRRLQMEIQKLTTDRNLEEKDVELSGADQREEARIKSEELVMSIDTLRHKNSVLSKQIEKLALDSNQKDKRIAQFEIEVKNLLQNNEKSIKLEDRNKELKNQLTTVGKELVRFQEMLKKNDGLKANLQNQICLLENLIDIKDKKIDETFKENAVLKADLLELQIKFDLLVEGNQEKQDIQSCSEQQRKCIARKKGKMAKFESHIKDNNSNVDDIVNHTEKCSLVDMDSCDDKEYILRMKSENQQLSEHCENIAKELDKVKRVLEKCNEEKDKFAAENERMKKEIESCKVEARGNLKSGDTICEQNKHFENAPCDAKTLLNKYLGMKTDAEHYMIKHTKVNDELRETRIKLTAMMEKIANLAEANMKLQNGKEQLKERIISIAHTLQQKEKELETVKARYFELDKLVTGLRREQDDSKGFDDSHQKMVATCASMKEKVERAFHASTLTSKEKTKAEEQLKDIIRENELLRDELKVCDKNRITYLNEIKHLHEDLEECRKNLMAVEQRGRQLRDAAQDAAQERDAAKQQNKALERYGYDLKLKENLRKIRTLEKEVELLSQVIKDKDSKYEILLTKYDTVKADKKQLEQRYSLSNISNQKYESIMKDTEYSKKSLEAKVDSLTRNISVLREENDELSLMHSQCLKENDTLSHIVKLNESKLHENEEQHNDLWQKYNNLRAELKEIKRQQARSEPYGSDTEKFKRRKADMTLEESIHGSQEFLERSTVKCISRFSKFKHDWDNESSFRMSMSDLTFDL